MRLSELYTVEAHSKGAEMRVKSPSKKPTDVYLTLAGLDSPQCRNAMKKAQKLLVLHAGDDDLDHVKMDIDIVVAATLGWRGLMDDNDQVAECSPEAAETLYRQAPYVLDQATAFMYDRKVFTKA
jgi:hypothetical protein